MTDEILKEFRNCERGIMIGDIFWETQMFVSTFVSKMYWLKNEITDDEMKITEETLIKLFELELQS